MKMTRLKFVILALIGFALGLAGDMEVNKISSTPGSTKTFEVTISKAQLIASSLIPTKTPNHSPGPPIQIRSSVPSKEGTKR